MKKLAVLSVLCTILCAGFAYGAADVCNIWEGTWDVKQASGDAVWVVTGPATASPPIIICNIKGTTTYGGEEKFMQILQVSFFAGKFIYSEDEQLGNDMGKQEITPIENDKGVVCSFTTEGVQYNDYGIISGTKRGGECETATTTTTIPDNGTTTTTVPPGTSCITLDPAEVTVNGVLNQTLDVKVAFTRTDILSDNLTQEDLSKLVITPDTACAENITVNSTQYTIAQDKIEATVNITVLGNAPASQCKITVSDPEGIVDPPLACEASFEIKNEESCAIQSLTPNSVSVGLGLLPRFQKITITLNKDIEEAGITGDDLAFDAPKGVFIINTEVSGSSITASVLFWGVQPGTYNINLGTCGSESFEVKGL